MHFTQLKDIVARLAADMGFRQSVLANPVQALATYSISVAEQERVQALARWTPNQPLTGGIALSAAANWPSD